VRLPDSAMRSWQNSSEGWEKRFTGYADGSWQKMPICFSCFFENLRAKNQMPYKFVACKAFENWLKS
jgi:hypothetical protein